MKNVGIKTIATFLIGIWAGILHHYIVNQADINKRIMDDKRKHLYLQTRYQYEEAIIKEGKEVVEMISTDSRTSPYYTAESLVYQLLMFNRYKKYDHCFWAYLALQKYSENDSYNEDNAKLFLEYLDYGAKNHSYKCIELLWQIYSSDIGMKKDSLKADSLEKVLESLRN